MEEYQYQDPVTRFLKELYVEFDFEGAQRELKEAVEVVGNDFFLNEFREEFLDNARYLISEAYCRIHQKIDIAYVPSSFLRFEALGHLTDVSISSSVTSRNASTSQKKKARSGLSISSERRGWAQMPRSILRRYVLSSSFDPLSPPSPPLRPYADAHSTERNRNQPPRPTSLPNHHRKDARTRSPYTSSWIGAWEERSSYLRSVAAAAATTAEGAARCWWGSEG
jgi:hypothetical protein